MKWIVEVNLSIQNMYHVTIMWQFFKKKKNRNKIITIIFDYIIIII